MRCTRPATATRTHGPGTRRHDRGRVGRSARVVLVAVVEAPRWDPEL